MPHVLLQFAPDANHPFLFSLFMTVFHPFREISGYLSSESFSIISVTTDPISIDSAFSDDITGFPVFASISFIAFPAARRTPRQPP